MLSAPVLYNAHQDQKRVLETLELALLMVVSCHVGAGSPIQVFPKKSQSS